MSVTDDLLALIDELADRVALLETGIETQGMIARSYTDATRPSAGNAGLIIFNTSDGQLNVDDGTNWTLPDGTAT